MSPEPRDIPRPPAPHARDAGYFCATVRGGPTVDSDSTDPWSLNDAARAARDADGEAERLEVGRVAAAAPLEQRGPRRILLSDSVYGASSAKSRGRRRPNA